MRRRWARPGRAQQSLVELEAIVVAIENGDADAAADASAHHVEDGGQGRQAGHARASTWDVVAVRYATLNSTRGALYYRWADYGEPDGEQVMDYFFYVLRGDGRTIVVDCGFDPVAGARRGRTCLTEPVEALRLLGIEPAEVETMLISHLHYDHIGNLGAFTKARFLVPERELAFWTSDVARYHGFWHHVEADEIARVADLTPRAASTPTAARRRSPPGSTPWRSAGTRPASRSCSSTPRRGGSC